MTTSKLEKIVAKMVGHRTRAAWHQSEAARLKKLLDTDNASFRAERRARRDQADNNQAEQAKQNQDHADARLLQLTDADADAARKLRRRAQRRARDEAYRSCGMVRVRGALGGVYWE